MLTVKHIHALGDEAIIEVSRVRFTPGTPAWESPDGQTGCSATAATVWVHDSKGTEVPLTGGTVFVMNEAGKTVSRYDLGPSPVPIVGDGLHDPRRHGLLNDQRGHGLAERGATQKAL